MKNLEVFTMHEKMICWNDIRDEIMTPQEQSECQDWLKELGKLMDARDAGKINVDEYCRLCFELDKKYGLADEDDAELYFEEVGEDENNFTARFAFVGG